LFAEGAFALLQSVETTSIRSFSVPATTTADAAAADDDDDDDDASSTMFYEITTKRAFILLITLLNPSTYNRIIVGFVIKCFDNCYDRNNQPH
jgi:hypothetical protein